MLAKKNKLHLKKELDFVYKNGKRHNSASFSVSFITKSGLGSRFAVFAPKKIFKKAHERNRAKRRMFEIIRLNYKNYPTNMDAIFFVKKDVLNKGFDLLQKEIEEMISQMTKTNY